MRLESLIYLIEISRCHSLNKAANNLFITQPALNLAITTLEKELGFPLVKRSKKGTTLTAAGEQVVADSKIILNYIQSWNRFSEPALDVYKDVLHIISFETIHQVILTDMVIDLKKKYPKLDIYNHVVRRNDIASVLSDKYNIALLAFTPFGDEEKNAIETLHKNHWKTELLGNYQFVTFVSSKNPLSEKKDLLLKDLNDFPVAIPPENRYPYDQIVQRLNDKDILYIDNKSSILALVAQDSAISFFPSIRTKNNFYIENNLICAKPIDDFPNIFNQYLIYPEKNLSPTELLIIETLKGCYEKIFS